MAKVSVVVATCQAKRYDSLVSLLDHLQGQTYGDLEAVVVVGENRRLYEKVREYARDRDKRGLLRVVFNPSNNGLSYDRNVGIASSTGDIVAFIDDDAYPVPGWVEEIARTFAEDGRCGAVVGDVEPVWENDGMKWFPRELYWMLSCSYTMTPGDKREVRRGFGVNMSFKRDLLARAGLFNVLLGVSEKRWIGGEDTDMFLKLQDLKSRVMFNPKARVYHRIDAMRVTVKSVVQRSYNGGYSVAMLRKVRGYSLKSSAEDDYLKSLIFGFYPRSIRSLAGGFRADTLRQMAYVAMVIAFEALGYASGLATIRLSDNKPFDIIGAELDPNAI